MSFLFPQDQVWDNSPVILIGSLRQVITQYVITSYIIVYYLVPKFFMKKKYVLFALTLLLLYIIIFVLGFLLISISLKSLTQAVGTTKEQPYIYLRGSLIRLFGNAPLICGLLLSLKTLKKFTKISNGFYNRRTGVI